MTSYFLTALFLSTLLAAPISAQSTLGTLKPLFAESAIEDNLEDDSNVEDLIKLSPAEQAMTRIQVLESELSQLKASMAPADKGELPSSPLESKVIPESQGSLVAREVRLFLCFAAIAMCIHSVFVNNQPESDDCDSVSVAVSHEGEGTAGSVSSSVVRSANAWPGSQAPWRKSVGDKKRMPADGEDVAPPPWRKTNHRATDGLLRVLMEDSPDVAQPHPAKPCGKAYLSAAPDPAILLRPQPGSLTHQQHRTHEKPTVHKAAQNSSVDSQCTKDTLATEMTAAATHLESFIGEPSIALPPGLEMPPGLDFKVSCEPSDVHVNSFGHHQSTASAIEAGISPISSLPHEEALAPCDQALSKAIPACEVVLEPVTTVIADILQSTESEKPHEVLAEEIVIESAEPQEVSTGVLASDSSCSPDSVSSATEAKEAVADLPETQCSPSTVPANCFHSLKLTASSVCCVWETMSQLLACRVAEPQRQSNMESAEANILGKKAKRSKQREPRHAPPNKPAKTKQPTPSPKSRSWCTWFATARWPFSWSVTVVLAAMLAVVLLGKSATVQEWESSEPKMQPDFLTTKTAAVAELARLNLMIEEEAAQKLLKGEAAACSPEAAQKLLTMRSDMSNLLEALDVLPDKDFMEVRSSMLPMVKHWQITIARINTHDDLTCQREN